MSEKNIESVLREDRVFDPPDAYRKTSSVASMEQVEELVQRASDDPEAFWADIASELSWFEPHQQVLSWNPPWAKWFVGAKTNVAFNCLDRQLAARGDKPAIIWEGEPGDTRTLSYRELHSEVCRFANALLKEGVVAGDRVMIYMPMIVETTIAMLACARVGATHSVVFGGFSAEALRDRTADAGAKIIITADGGFRRGKPMALKVAVDRVADQLSSVQRVIVVKRTEQSIAWNDSRDRWWHDLVSEVDDKHDAASLDSEHPLFILYTSGTTGRPKGVVHTTGGYMVGAYYTTKMVFDLKEDDIYWCTADVGWITGHSYIVYGPLLNGATILMYEGAPNFPEPDRLWKIVAAHKATIFYTAPTAIRTFIRWGDKWPQNHDLSSLRLLGTVGEPINPKAWMWYRDVIGGGRCPIVDTWWQTETGGIMISPLPGATPTKPGSCTRPLPGIVADVVDKDGKSCGVNEGGYLVIKKPWPSMLRTVYGDDDRYVQTYWSEIPGMYFAGDGARKDEDGYFWVMGRVDDVINVSGHRLGTMEIESALVAHDSVAEAAVVGRPDDIKGQAICAFVTVRLGVTLDPALADTLRQHVVEQIGALARPAEIRFTDALPKTRSGKIMRRLLKEIATTGVVKGDVSTLEDQTVVEKLSRHSESG